MRRRDLLKLAPAVLLLPAVAAADEVVMAPYLEVTFDGQAMGRVDPRFVAALDDAIRAAEATGEGRMTDAAYLAERARLATDQLRGLA